MCGYASPGSKLVFIFTAVMIRHVLGFPSNASCGSWRRAATLTHASSLRIFFSAKNSSTHTDPTMIPRAAVSVCVQCSIDEEDDEENHYLLVQRGQAPNKGLWSLPGGKLEYGETSLAGAQRELQEETSGINVGSLQWYPEAVTTTDAIGTGYHYVIGHYFATLTVSTALPGVQAHDDASDAKWLRLQEVQELEGKQHVTPGVSSVILRIQALSGAGLLPCI